MCCLVPCVAWTHSTHNSPLRCGLSYSNAGMFTGALSTLKKSVFSLECVIPLLSLLPQLFQIKPALIYCLSPEIISFEGNLGSVSSRARN